MSGGEGPSTAAAGVDGGEVASRRGVAGPPRGDHRVERIVEWAAFDLSAEDADACSCHFEMVCRVDHASWTARDRLVEEADCAQRRHADSQRTDRELLAALAGVVTQNGA